VPGFCPAVCGFAALFNSVMRGTAIANILPLYNYHYHYHASIFRVFRVFRG